MNQQENPIKTAYNKAKTFLSDLVGDATDFRLEEFSTDKQNNINYITISFLRKNSPEEQSIKTNFLNPVSNQYSRIYKLIRFGDNNEVSAMENHETA